MPNEIKLYGVIGEDINAVEVKHQLDAMDQTQPLTVRIHSEGGSVSDGMAMYDAFTAYTGPKRAVIESAAFSIASYIAMAFDDVEITENGYLMIHNPHMEIAGDDAALQHGAGVLAKLKASMVQAYSKKTGKSEDEVLAIMKAETWINAQEALAARYVNRITAPKQMKAVARLTKIPQGVMRSLCGDVPAVEVQRVEQGETMSDTKPVAASLSEIKAALPKAKAEFVLNCIERSLPMASVLSEAFLAMDEELTATKAKLAEFESKASAMEQEASAKAMEDEEMAKAKAMEEEDEEVVARAKAKSGVKPVAKSKSTSKVNAKLAWESAFATKVASGMPRAQAINVIDKEQPGLREQMIEEVNQSRSA